MRYWSNDNRETLAGQRVPWNIWEPFPESEPDPIPLLSRQDLEALLRAKNIRSQWAYKRKRRELPTNIPSDPATYYEDWTLWSLEGFLPFKKAREYVRELGLQSKADWKRWSREERPDSIPSNPHDYYEGEGWVNWGDWLGTGRKSKLEMRKGFLSFEKARGYVRSQGLLSQDDWARWSRDERPEFIPSSPHDFYEGEGWVSLRDWLGTDFLPFEAAREYVRQLGLQSQADWSRWSRDERPDFIPSDPRKTYHEEGWVSMGDWLGTGRKGGGRRKDFLPFEKAREYMRKLGLLSSADWHRWSREERPDFIPSDPRRTYREEGWAGLGDWLKYPPTEETSGYRVVGARPWQTLMGRRKPWDVPVSFQESEFGLAPMMSHHELESLLRAKNIRSQLAYSRKRRELPVNIPSDPATYYEDWTLWGQEGYPPFEEAREYVRRQGFLSNADWRSWSRDERPDFIPSNPNQVYAGKGWMNWGNWLGTGRKSAQEISKDFLPFEEAREYVRKQGLQSTDDWWRWSEEERPKSIPSQPHDHYKGKGWMNWGNWLGTGRKSPQEISKDFLPFEEARVWVQEHKVASDEDEWKEWAKSSARPPFIPWNPRRYYRGKGWQGFMNWLGTESKRGGRRKDFLSFEEARDYVRRQHMTRLERQSARDAWRRWSQEKRPDFIPSHPDDYYKGKGWAGYRDWLNYPPTEETSGYRVVGARPWQTLMGQRKPWDVPVSFQESELRLAPMMNRHELESLLRAKNIRSQWAYKRKRRKLPVNIPSDPVTYYEDWTLWGQERYLPFEEAKKYVRNLGLQSKDDWERWSATERPDSIPGKPEKVYLEEGWADYGDWLGTGRKGGGRRKDFLPFEKAREYVRQLGLQSTDDWKRWSREERPDFIPGAPGTYYKGEGWMSFGDWLGTKEDFLPFEAAREYVRQLGLQSQADWSRWSRDERPDFIPSDPSKTYSEEGWVGIGDWLGTGRKSTQEISMGHRPFEVAREYVRQLGLQSQADWKRWSREKRPDFIPSTPDEHYKEKGWVNWGNWLGTKSRRGKDFLPFEEARDYVRRQRLQSKADWKRWSREERPNFIPSDPRKTYREEGWMSLRDWLGTDFLPFEAAREYVRKLGLLSSADWKRWSRDERPNFIPSKPEKVYLEEGWAGMVDWLEYPPTEETSGYRVVGARPWQITPSQPVLRVSSEVQAPVAITVEGNRVRFEFLPEWDQLPQWIKRVAAAVAIDMATVTVFGPTEQHLEEMQEDEDEMPEDPREFIEGAAHSIEEFAQKIIDNPTEVPEEAEHFAGIALGYGNLGYVRPSSIATAIAWVINDWTESAILEALSSFECYEPLGPIPAGEDLEFYYNSDMPELSFSWRFPNPRNNPAAVRDCMEPWLNIWWQEVLHTIAFEFRAS